MFCWCNLHEYEGAPLHLIGLLVGSINECCVPLLPEVWLSRSNQRMVSVSCCLTVIWSHRCLGLLLICYQVGVRVAMVVDKGLWTFSGISNHTFEVASIYKQLQGKQGQKVLVLLFNRIVPAVGPSSKLYLQSCEEK